MLVLNLLKTLAFLSLAITISACSYLLLSNANSQPISSLSEDTMPSSMNVLPKSVTLLAREENTAPLGISPDRNRDIGFASVFLRLENHKEANVKVTIKRIEIRNTTDSQVQMVNSSPQEIVLRPLENAEVDFQLTNKTGYSNPNPVKAVITYQIGDRLEVIESSPVEVKRW